MSFLRFHNEVSTTNSSLRSYLQHTQVFLRCSPDIELHAARLKQVELLADEVATKPTGNPATKKAGTKSDLSERDGTARSPGRRGTREQAVLSVA